MTGEITSSPRTKNITDHLGNFTRISNKKEKPAKWDQMYEKNLEWLQDLDSRDSNPNDNRVDINLFTKEVGKFGYKPTSTKVEDPSINIALRGYNPLKKETNSVSIFDQAKAMTNQYFLGIDF